MTPVFPYQVRRSEDGWGGELLLRLKEGKVGIRSEFVLGAGPDVGG